MVNGERRPDLATLEAILSALPGLTNEPVTLVVEVEELRLTSITGPVTQTKLPVIPGRGGKPKGLKGIVPKGGNVSDAVREGRNERESRL